MLLVIIGHLSVFCWKDTTSELFRWLASFEMPLFFYLSGLMAHRAMKESYSLFIVKKIVTLLFPFSIVGGIYVGLIVQPDTCRLFWYVLSHGEYWFTFCLFEVFILFRIFYWLYNKIFNKNNDILIIGGGYWGIVILGFRAMQQFHLIPVWLDELINLTQVISYLPYFIIGALVFQYKELEHIVMSQFGFIVSFIVYWIIYFASGVGISPLFGTHFLSGLTGTIWILYFLKRLDGEASMTESEATALKPDLAKWLGVLLARIGRRSLDVYVLHYYFLFWLPMRKYAHVILGNGFMFELVVSIVLALLVATCAMTLSAILRSSDLFAFIFLGDWSKRPQGLMALRPKSQSSN
jgi:fucose 4-O-acetylase-like acetyltransferase